MATDQPKVTDDKLARVAGVTYLLMLPTAAPAIMGGLLAVQPEPAETLAYLSDNLLSFQVMTLLGVVGFIVFLVLAMLLHRLLRANCPPAADIMLAFVAVSVPVSLAAMAIRLDIAQMVTGHPGLPVLSGAALADAVSASLGRSNNMMQVAVMFWGLWLLPLAQLARASEIVPRWLAILLTIGGLHYVVSFAFFVFDPTFQQDGAGMVMSGIGGLAAMIGEIGFALWLTVKGAKRTRPV